MGNYQHRNGSELWEGLIWTRRRADLTKCSSLTRRFQAYWPWQIAYNLLHYRRWVRVFLLLLVGGTKSFILRPLLACCTSPRRWVRVIVEQLVEWRLAGETEVGSQRLTAWAMARPTYLVSTCVYSVFCAVMCTGSGLAEGWSPVQGVLSTV
jgi:hypothetical protein